MIQQRQLAVPSYLVAFAFAVIPPIDAIMQTVPFQLHNVRWRYGAFGLLSNALMMPLLGVFLFFLVAAMFEHRRFQKVLAVICGIIGLLTLAALAMFTLDVLQVRGQVVANPGAKFAFNVATLTAFAKAILGIITLGAFAWAGFRAPKAKKVVQTTTRGGGMLVGSPVATPAPTPISVGNRVRTMSVKKEQL